MAKKIAARGRRVRGKADISCTDTWCAGIELVQELLDGPQISATWINATGYILPCQVERRVLP